jgi:nucleotide-binding universal stress UspA family protein
MTRIVLATDFSPSANRAAHTAAHLAHAWQSELLLLNVFRYWPGNPAETGDFPLSYQATHDASQKALQKLAAQLREEVSPDLPIRCLTREGHTRTVINDVALTEQADLLVMATVGTAPQSVRFMGSVATDMVAETRVPLLLLPPNVPGNHALAEVQHVAIAISLSTPPDALTLDTALEMARRLGATVHGLCVCDNPDEDPILALRLHRLRNLFERQGHDLTLLPDTDTSGQLLYETLLHAAEARKAGLLMMLPQPQSWLKQLLSEGETQRMARLTTLPLLAVV